MSHNPICLGLSTIFTRKTPDLIRCLAQVSFLVPDILLNYYELLLLFLFIELPKT